MQIPHHCSQVAFGLGIDLPCAPVDDGSASTDSIGACVDALLERHTDELRRMFVCWQPRDFGWLAGRDPLSTYDELFDRVAPHVSAQALHHGGLNLAALEPYDRTELVELANALVHRHGFSWLNEDLALESIRGKPLPYPFSPYLTDYGLAAAIENTRRVKDHLLVPLLIEFPGFGDGATFFIGPIHAYDFFRMVAEKAEVGVTLDTSHLLSYEWLLGRRGDELFRELDLLPLRHCFEIRLSGCRVGEGSVCGTQHGTSTNEQIELLERLLALCPNVHAVTYEESLFAKEGEPYEAIAQAAARLCNVLSSRRGQ